MHDPSHLDPDLIYPIYKELRDELPVLPPRVHPEHLKSSSPDLATRAFSLPLVWAERTGESEFGYRGNAARLALVLANEGPPAVHAHLAQYAQMLGMVLAQDVAASVRDAGPAMLEELVAQPEIEPRSIDAEDRARVRQAAYNVGMDLHKFEASLYCRAIH